jgi:hypothetical protein
LTSKFANGFTQADVPIILTLVHGTFARDAAWMNEDSPIPSLLREWFFNAKITRFNWSGENDVLDRLHAAEDLLAHLVDNQTKHPLSRQYIIGHSHGGNVALRAAGIRGTKANIQGVACLATPFISATMRNNIRFNFPEFFLGIVLLLGICLAPINMMVLVIINSTCVVIINALMYIVVTFIVFDIYSRMSNDQKETMTTLCKLMSSRVVEGSNLCIIRSTGDEASLLLSTSLFLSWVSSSAFSMRVRPNTRSSKRWIGGFIFVLSLDVLSTYLTKDILFLIVSSIYLLLLLILPWTRRYNILDVFLGGICCGTVLLSTILVAYATGNLPKRKGSNYSWIRKGIVCGGIRRAGATWAVEYTPNLSLSFPR